MFSLHFLRLRLSQRRQATVEAKKRRIFGVSGRITQGELLIEEEERPNFALPLQAWRRHPAGVNLTYYLDSLLPSMSDKLHWRAFNSVVCPARANNGKMPGYVLFRYGRRIDLDGFRRSIDEDSMRFINQCCSNEATESLFGGIVLKNADGKDTTVGRLLSSSPTISDVYRYVRLHYKRDDDGDVLLQASTVAEIYQ